MLLGGGLRSPSAFLVYMCVFVYPFVSVYMYIFLYVYVCFYMYVYMYI